MISAPDIAEARPDHGKVLQASGRRRQSIIGETDMNRKSRSGMRLAAAVIPAIFLSTATEARVIRQIDKKAKGVELFLAGLLNPFPAVFMAGRDGDVLVLARDDPSAFEAARVKRSIESPGAGLTKLDKSKADKLRSYFPEIKPGEAVVFFLTVDETLTREGSEAAAKTLTPARAGVDKATTPVTLAVLKATK